MSRSFDRAPLRARAATLLLLITAAVVACGKADASARQGKGTAADSAASKKPAVVASVVPMPGAGADTAIDSATVANADRGRVAGSDTAMWVVMISDFQCPYCKQWHDSSMKRLERDYIAPGKIHFAYLHLPLSSIHRHARAEAEAAMCASAQGKFWPYSEALFAAQPKVGAMESIEPLLTSIATDLKLDAAAFKSCRAGGAVRALVNNDIQQATKSGVQSTPSFIVGDFLVQGALPYADFRKAIDTALAMRARKGKAP
jgi:protein-disulfide isomerase